MFNASLEKYSKLITHLVLSFSDIGIWFLVQVRLIGLSPTASQCKMAVSPHRTVSTLYLLSNRAGTV